MQEPIQEANTTPQEEEVSFFSTVDSTSFWEESNQQVEPGIEDPNGQPQQAVEGQQEPQGEPQPQSTIEPQPLPEHMKPEDAYKMARYMQSEKDKVRQQNLELQKQLEALQAANPIGQYAAQDPAFMAHVAAYLSGSSSGNQPGGATQAGGTPQPDLPQKPVRPKRPANLEPYSDEAAEYQQKLDEYYEQRDAWFENQQEAMVRQRQQIEEQQQLQQEHIATQRQVYNQARYEYGLNDQQAQEFLQWAQDPQNLNRMDLWINAFRLDKKIVPGQPAQQQRTPVNGNGQLGPIGRRVQQVQTAAAIPAGGAPPQEDSFFVQREGGNSIW